MSQVSIRGLGVRFGGHTVIDRLDLEVADGEFLVLLGPSGCGKSTLLHAIAGLTEVNAGTLGIGGRDMTGAEPSERGIGMVFQSYALYPTMTVEGNMAFGLRMAGLPRAEIRARIQHAARLLHLEEVLHRKPGELSGGQRQRVAIGRAMVRQAQVFLLDEPLSNLDAKLRAELRRELKLLHRQMGSTMIYVTHDQVEAMTLADRIAVMQGGVIQQLGSPEEVYARPRNRFVAGFLGAPAMNFVDGQLAVRDGALHFVAAGLELDLASCPLATRPESRHELVLGLRPEHLLPRQQGRYAGTVQVVEAMGNFSVVWLERHGLVLSVLLAEGRAPAAGETMRFDIDSSRVSLFDRASGLRL